MLFSYTIRDARGVRRRVSPRLTEGLIGESDPRLRLLREYYRLRSTLESRVVLGVLLCLSAGIAGLGVAVYFMAQGYSREERLMLLGLAVMGAIAVPLSFRLRVWWRKRSLVARGVAQIRLCACCGDDMGGVRPEDDGCVVCPGCGAAWK